MVSIDRTQHRIVLHTAEKRCLWQARLLLEDEEGTHEAVFAEDSVQAGPWRVAVTCSAADGLDRVAIEVFPAGERVLKTVTLEVPGGEQGLPDLTSPHTKALVFAPRAFDPDGVVPLGPEASLRSRLAVVVGRTVRTPVLLWGLGGPAEDLALFTIAGGRLRAGFEVGRALAEPVAFPLLAGAGPEPLPLLEAYGKALAACARPRSPVPTGWNTWDYYAGAITMNDVRREMTALVESGLSQRLRYVVLDMGWEQTWGEWAPNRRFPGSFHEIAAEIRAAGFTPGIWVAPLQCHLYAPLGRHRQELLARGPDGFPALVGQHGVFDFTLDDVRDIVRHWFGEMADAGFRFFKLDYLYPEYLEAMAQCADRRRGRAGVIRRGLETIRQAVGEESHILNCGGPVEAALGIADSSRATVDIHTFWGHVRHNARQLSCRLWQHGRLWTVDPDFALVRCRQTSKDRYLNPLRQHRPLVEGQSHWLAGEEATLAELQVWLTQVYLSAGSVFLGDSVARLTPAGTSALAKLFPVLPEPARPLDLFLNPVPRYWLGSDGRRDVVGIFNWGDEPLEAAPPRGIEIPTKGVDVWTGRRVEITLETRQKPRSAWLLRV